MSHYRGLLMLAATIAAISYCTTSLAAPVPSNPNAEYEIIDPKHPLLVTGTPKFVPLSTPRPSVVTTPPTEGKNFVYDPVSKSWTELTKDSPAPAEGALVWNQRNDKWLTMVARV